MPTCAWCNRLLADVPSTLSSDPNDPEHERLALHEQRTAIIRRQVRSAAIVYSLTVALLAVLPGMIFTPATLALYGLSALIVAWAVIRNLAGRSVASIIQGALTVLLLLCFGPIHPFTPFMILGHLTVPVFFWHWIELIDDVNR
jgi:hypothetical protein